MKGRIIRGVGGNYFVYLEDKGLYMCRARGIFRKRNIKPNVGDLVEIDITHEGDKEGNLTRIYPRNNQLVRPMVANVDQAMVLFSIHDPEPNHHLLNCFLITMEQQGIPVMICFNKMDLASEEEMRKLEEDYAGCGCRLFFISAEKKVGLAPLEDMIRGRTTVMAGPSGVGKSSLLNCLSSGKQMETGSISRKIRRGRHTTRHSELIHIGPETYMMDTPGFSSLYLTGMEKEELKEYFPEFHPYEGRCRFLDCVHINEPDCAVRNALEEGAISRRRYEDYCQFYEELRDRKKY
jgi:ribosome biogenesis GTPase